MPINCIYPHYPKPNPTPPLKRRDQNSPFATVTSLKNNDTALGPPTKKLAIIEMEPILANDFYETAGPRNLNSSPKPRTNENAWSLVTQMKFTYWGHFFGILDNSRQRSPSTENRVESYARKRKHHGRFIGVIWRSSAKEQQLDNSY
jgi:hypothetical protein